MSLTTNDKKRLTKFLTSPVMNDQIDFKFDWHNYMNTSTQHDAITIDIKSRMALHSLLRTIHTMNEKKDPEQRIIVRMAAGGKKNDEHSASYSATNVVNADIIIRLTGDDFSKVTRIGNSNIVRVGASTQIGELDRILYEKFQLTTPSASLIPYVTAAGLSAAGGHGTGRDQPSFAGEICGATFCLETGEIVHIDKTHPDFKTIMGAHNGLFGAILDLDIECIPAQKMECVMEKRSPIEFMEEVEKGLFDNDPYVSVMYVPTYLPDELTNRTVNNVIIYRWRPVPLDTRNTNHQPVLSAFEQSLEQELGKAVNIPEVLRSFPKLIPFYMRHIASKITIGDKDKLSVGPWHEMMHYRTSYPNDLDEICGIFPVKDQPRNMPQAREIVEAMKKSITLLGEHAKRGEYPITYALYFRFLQGTNGGLSITDHPDGSHICALDLTTNYNVKGFAEFKKNMQDFFLNEMHGKLHWGKNAPFDLDYEKLYGDRWQETKSALEKWHQKNGIQTERSMLLNPLFSHVLKYPAPSLVDTDTPPLTRSLSKQHITAVQASKLADKIVDNSIDGKQVKADIHSQIQKNALKAHSTFPAAPTQQVAAEKEEEKQNCVML